jgi:hypothetical protein
MAAIVMHTLLIDDAAAAVTAAPQSNYLISAYYRRCNSIAGVSDKKTA